MTWPTKKLGEVLSEIKNGTTGKQNKQGVGYPVTRIETVQDFSIDKDRIGFVELPTKEFEKYKLRCGDILFSHINSEEHLGKVAIYNGEIKNLVLGMNLLRFRANEKQILPHFLYYFFLTGNAKTQIKKNAKRAVNQASINQAQIKKFLIPLPPLAIQKQIVERMNKIVEVRKLNDELIQKADELFQSLLHKELNPVSKKWDVKKLDEIVDINYGKGLEKTYRNEKGKYYAYGSNGPIYRTDKTLIEESTIIIGRKGGAGLLWMTEEPSWPIDTTFYLRVKAKHNTYLKFLYFSLQTKKLQKLAIVTAVPGINRSTLYNVRVPLPTFKIQKQIVAKLSAAQEYKNQLLNQKAKLKELFDSVLHKSMNGELIN